MDKPHEEIAGYKHRSTNKFLNYFKKEIMDMCIQEGLHQIDLLSPAETKVTQAEYMTQKSGQKKLEETNKKIIADGLKPTATHVQTQKQELRMPSKNAARILKAFRNSNLCFWRNIRYPSLKKEEDIVISILIETNGLQRRLWELNTAKNI